MTNYKCTNCGTLFPGGLPAQTDEVGAGTNVAVDKFDCPVCGNSSDGFITY